MANISTGGDGGSKRSKPKRLNLRVDFTPMVDMNMLLLTFFMFCTTLSKPQIMEIVMPADDKDLTDEERDVTKESKTITVLLGKDDKVYYYLGKPNYEDYTALIETSFAPEGGLRDLLLERNADAVQKMIELKREKHNKKVSEDEYNERRKKITGDKENVVVIIKPTVEAVYANLVDALDEMAICSIGVYAIVDVKDGDNFMMKNYETKGTHAAEHEIPKH